MKRLIFLLFGVFFLTRGVAQERKLTLQEFLLLVKKYHPVALQADLTQEKAFFIRREALGGFDPKIEVSHQQKIFNGKTYYEYFMPEVKVPLWYGIDLKGSFSSYKGDYVNPENKIPNEGLGYLGLSMPLGKGLIIDDRRAALKQAKIYQDMAVNERQQLLNQLLLEATSTYVRWLNSWLNAEIYKKAVGLARERAEGTRTLVVNGDRPAIDTLEAGILLQSRQQKLTEYQTLLINYKNDISAYLWLDNLKPDTSGMASRVPDERLLTLEVPESLLKGSSAIIALNPELRNYGLKLEQLEVERRLKLEEIKPTLNFQVGLLNTGRNIFDNINMNWLQNNQKMGFSFSMPLTFTKQRASYSLAKLKIREASYELSDKNNLLITKWENHKNELANLDIQLKTFRDMVASSKQLLKGEEIKFQAGESSLFLINAREQKLLDMQEKLNEILSKRVIVIQYLKWIGNSLNVD